MGRQRLGVAGQTASFVRDADDAVHQIHFTRPFPVEVGDRLRFEECSFIDARVGFDVSAVERGRRVVTVDAVHLPPTSRADVVVLESGLAVAEQPRDAEAEPAVEEVVVQAEEEEEHQQGEEADEGMEERSTDGSDTEGSLADFIEHTDDEEANDDDDEAEEGRNDEPELTAEAEVRELVAEFPFDRALLEDEDPAPSRADGVDGAVGVRRSRRTRAPVKRYVDSNYASLMLEDASDLSDSSEEDASAKAGSGSDADMDFVVGDDDESASEEEESSFEG